MRKSIAVAWGLVALIGLFLAGCKNDTGPSTDQVPAGVTNEQQAMAYFAQNDEFVANTPETFGDASEAAPDYSSSVLQKTDEAISPLRWGRIITQFTKTVTTTVEPGDTIAIAKVENDIVGKFKVRGFKPNQTGGNDTVTVEKPFNDKSLRYIIFKRIARSTDRYWLNWVPVATSLVHGQTVEPVNITITKVELTLPGGKVITIDDPDKYFLRYRWLRIWNGGNDEVPELLSGDPVKLKVTVESVKKDTDLVALRYGCTVQVRNRRLMRCVSETQVGDKFLREFATGTPTLAAPVVGVSRGYFHIGIDAITKETVYDDAAPYSSSWWGVPYRVF
jgi:hypothetical protein